VTAALDATLPPLAGVDAEPEVAARVALVADGRALRYDELAGRVRRAAVALAGAGIGARSRVALTAYPRVDTVVAILALAELGATLVPLHPRLTPAEADAIAADAAVDLRVRDDAPEALEELASQACGCLGAAFRPDDLVGAAHDPESALAIIHTSGTSGRPKGAVLSRRAFAASAAASARNLGWTPDDRWLLAMPLAHVGGLSILTRSLAARRTVVLEPRFDPAAVLAAITRERVTLLSVVPTMLAALLDEDRQGALASLRAVLVGGAAAPARLLDECARRRVPALTTYGLTETCSQVASQRPRDAGTLEPGSGRALPGVELRVARADASPALAGEVGRIVVRGPMLMSGYWQGRGAPLAAPFDDAGFFDTGDLGALDEQGRLHVEGRRADLVVTGGENVYPAEVERALEACAGVGQALVFGVDDERWGQLVACAIVPDSTVPFDEARVARELAARLAPHKRPRRLCVVEALPVARSGKLARDAAPPRFAGALVPWPTR
jgi:O-succinylbenzoic acid--CoA ligase